MRSHVELFGFNIEISKCFYIDGFRFTKLLANNHNGKQKTLSVNVKPPPHVKVCSVMKRFEKYILHSACDYKSDKIADEKQKFC